MQVCVERSGRVELLRLVSRDEEGAGPLSCVRPSAVDSCFRTGMTYATSNDRRPGPRRRQRNGMRPRRCAVDERSLCGRLRGSGWEALRLAQPLLPPHRARLSRVCRLSGLAYHRDPDRLRSGILFIVPLGDLHDRRNLIPVMMLCAATALTLCALAPSMSVVLIAIAICGVTTVSAQILIPRPGDLADDARGGRVISRASSGVLAGFPVSRTANRLSAAGDLHNLGKMTRDAASDPSSDAVQPAASWRTSRARRRGARALPLTQQHGFRRGAAFGPRRSNDSRSAVI